MYKKLSIQYIYMKVGKLYRISIYEKQVQPLFTAGI